MPRSRISFTYAGVTSCTFMRDHLIRVYGEPSSAKLANVFGSHFLHFKRDERVHVGLQSGLFQAAVILAVRALHLETDELVLIGIKACVAQSRTYSGVMSCTRIAIMVFASGCKPSS